MTVALLTNDSIQAGRPNPLVSLTGVDMTSAVPQVSSLSFAPPAELVDQLVDSHINRLTLADTGRSFLISSRMLGITTS